MYKGKRLPIFFLISLVLFINTAVAQPSDCGPWLEGRPHYMAIKAKYPAGSEILQLIQKNLPENVQLLTLGSPIDSFWVQDYFPISVTNDQGTPELVSFKYANSEEIKANFENTISAKLFGIGEVPSPIPNSHQAAQLVATQLGRPLRKSSLVMHGGHFLAADDGTILVSREVKYKKNPQWSLQDIESELKLQLYAKQVIWLPAIFGEPTGHIDIYAMPLGERKILLQRLPGQNFWNDYVTEAQNILEAHGFQVLELKSSHCERLYINSIRVDRMLFMPVYGHQPFFRLRPHLDEADQAARDQFTALGFQVIPVPVGELAGKMGALHCLTKSIL